MQGASCCDAISDTMVDDEFHHRTSHTRGKVTNGKNANYSCSLLFNHPFTVNVRGRSPELLLPQLRLHRRELLAAGVETAPHRRHVPRVEEPEHTPLKESHEI